MRYGITGMEEAREMAALTEQIVANLKTIEECQIDLIE